MAKQTEKTEVGSMAASDTPLRIGDPVCFFNGQSHAAIITGMRETGHADLLVMYAGASAIPYVNVKPDPEGKQAQTWSRNRPEAKRPVRPDSLMEGGD